MKTYLLVSGDFVPTGGMDMANLALASHLAERGDAVHLVTHRAVHELRCRANVIVHRVPKPADSYLLGAPLLDRVGRRWAARIAAAGGRVIVNGGNCLWGDVNWVHYVHSVYQPPVAGSALLRLKSRWAHRRFVNDERRALGRARVVIANSKRTKRDLVERVGIRADGVHTIYCGIDADRFRPPTADERATARAMLALPEGRLTVAFVGAVGDRRKGFDTVFAAWKALCADPTWDADLAVVGAGAELSGWRARAAETKLASRIRFLGFREDVPAILAGCDALVAPARYEAYGLAVQEALCCGLPALVSAGAGVAERYPPELHHLLIPDPEDAVDLAERLRTWRRHAQRDRAAVAPLSLVLRACTWERMAAAVALTLETAA